MKSCALCILAVCVPVAAQQKGIHIEAIGLQRFYTTAVPAPVQVYIPALSETQTIQVEFTITSSGDSNGRGGVIRTDQFRKQVQMASGKPLEIEVPILLPGLDHQNLHVIAKDSHGEEIGEDELNLNFLVNAGLQSWSLVAIYCREDRKCVDAQEQISPIGTGAETAKRNNEFKFALLKELRQNWWAYRAASALVLAGPISDTKGEESKALDFYLRSGGALVLLEKEVANPNFLAAYRQSAPRVEPAVVGRGRLYRLSSLEANGLADLFRAKALDQVTTSLQQFVTQQSVVQQILGRVGTSFSFPGLPRLLTWLGLYILIIGPVNFVILRRLRRREWGWLTASVISLLFATGLYVASSSRRPKHFTLDSVEVYWMDGQSPVAQEDIGLRVSSPKRIPVAILVNNDVVLDSPQMYGTIERSPGVDLAVDITDRRRIQPGWQVHLGTPLGIETSMFKWSFKDFYLESFHEFPGTVHWTSGMRLKNETGQRFREGIYLDYKANKRYTIPVMASGEEVDLATMIPKKIWTKREEGVIENRLGNVWVAGQAKRGPFSVEEMAHPGWQLGSGNRVFVGVGDVPLRASLDVAEPDRYSLVLTVVSLN